MTLRVWLIFLITETALSLSPGPAVLFVVAQGLSVGGLRSAWAALGIVSGNALMFALSGLGIGAAILTTGHWFWLLKWLGAAYLIFLALRTLLGGASLAGDPQAQAGGFSSWRLWWRAVLLQIANPKALIFFVALLPQFVEPERDVGWQILILGLTSVLAEFPVLVAYGALAGRASRLAREKNYGRTIDVVASVLLIVAALGIALADYN